MPCFKGLAVSIHANGLPIAEHGVQKQSRASRISTYIPVPAPRPNPHTGELETATFAISITLLVPGLNVPYSKPEPTLENPNPEARIVAGLPGYKVEKGAAMPVQPYIPRTSNPNETVAAYIYFDGRVKEEVATLLRRGEETWVNSRWVSVPESEGGGLAEREFLFREVGLERWLNGLDLEGSKDKAERIERRQRRLEKKRRKERDPEIKKEEGSDDEDVKDAEAHRIKRKDRNGVLRYGDNGQSPMEEVEREHDFFSSDSDSEDEPPEPEAAGQIKVALFRVLASGEIRRGEYSPQFGAHDDDDDMEGNGASNGDGGDADHTTSFAKPKTLDPKSISTQTVTGLDTPETPYAVFTFFYRGEKQLRKMGILQTPSTEKHVAPSKRKASGPDFSKLGPLKHGGTVGFSGYRDSADAAKRKAKKGVEDMDSDGEDEDEERVVNGEDEGEVGGGGGDGLLSPEDARQTGELAQGVQKIRLKRQHSAEPLADAAATRKSPHIKSDENLSASTPHSVNSTAANAGTPPEGMSPAPQLDAAPAEVIGSPFKRARPSLPGLGEGMFGGDNVFAAAPDGGNEGAEAPQPQTHGMQDDDEELLGPRLSRKRRKVFGCAVPPPRTSPAGSSTSKGVERKKKRRVFVVAEGSGSGFASASHPSTSNLRGKGSVMGLSISHP